MIKIIIAIVFLLFAGIMWLRTQWARSKNSGTARQIVEDLKSGKYIIESYADSLNIQILTKKLEQIPSPESVKLSLQTLAGKRFAEKFSIQYADINSAGNGIIIAEAKVSDTIPLYSSNKEVDIHFPCWLYISFDVPNNKVEFRSTFPESKDHHYLLEDLATEICKLTFKA